MTVNNISLQKRGGYGQGRDQRSDDFEVDRGISMKCGGGRTGDIYLVPFIEIVVAVYTILARK